MVSFK